MKPALKSKTLWVNFIMALTAIVFPPANAYMVAHPEVVASVFAGVNIVLRIITKDKLTLGE